MALATFSNPAMLAPATRLPSDLFEGPGQPGAVLAHLEGGSGDSSGVGGLGGTEEDSGLLEGCDRTGGAGHVGSLGDGEASVGDEHLGVVLVELVLGGAGEGDVAGDGPDALALGILGGGDVVDVGLYPVPLDLLDLLEGPVVDSVVVLDVSVGVGDGDDLGSQLGGLLAGVDGDVSGSGDDDLLALEGLSVGLQHLVGEVAQPVSGGLGPGEGSAGSDGLSGEDSGELVLEPLVLAEHVSDLSSAHSDVAGGDVGVGADVLGELGHEGLAEAHDLVVGLALGVEVGSSLSSSYGEGGEAPARCPCRPARRRGT